MANKVQFGIKNCHYAVITKSTTGTFSYATPVALPGAVNISLDPSGEVTPFYADNMVYYNAVSNNGYTGTLELAKIPDSFFKDIFGRTLTTGKVLMEDATVEPKEAALLFQIEGDQTDERYLIYEVTFNRPGFSSATITDSKEPNTQSIEFSAIPSTDTTRPGIVSARTTDETTSTIKSGWYSNVYSG